MAREEPRIYRSLMNRKGLVRFNVRHLETDLHIQAQRNLTHEVSRWIIEARIAIEGYARRHPGFLESLEPLEDDPLAPPVVREMLLASSRCGVGPMASVAGAIANQVGRRILERIPGSEVFVENGGDLFVQADSPFKVAIFAGTSPFSGRIGISLPGKVGQFGICTSSGTVGHSRSFGRADAVTVVSHSASLSDAAATAVGNLVSTARDIARGLEAMQGIEGVLGGLIIKGSRIGAWGNIELVSLA